MIKKWWNRQIKGVTITTAIVMTLLIESIKFLLSATIIYLTGLLLIDVIAGLPYFTPLQALAVTFWFKIIVFNLQRKKSK